MTNTIKCDIVVSSENLKFKEMMAVKYLTLVCICLSVVCSTGALAMDQSELPGVVARIAAVTHRKIDVQVVENSEFNAWTDPDGHIGITSAFVAALTPDQAAFVLGHESTHVVEEHAVKQLKATLWGALAAAAAAYLVGVRGNDLGTVAQVGGTLNGAHQSRTDEYQSDNEGLKYSVQAGYRAEGGPEAMRILEQRCGRGDARIPIAGSFASHPDTHNRVVNLERVAAKLEAEQPVPAPTTLVAATPELAGALYQARRPVALKQAPVAPATVTSEAPVVPTTPEKLVPVIETPSGATVTDPNLKFRFGDIVSHALKGNETLSVESAPTGTSKVTFRLLGADGQLVMQGETSTVNPALVTLSLEQLRSFGSRLQLTITALDASGHELDLTTITIVVQQ